MPKILPIIKAPNDILRKKSSELPLDKINSPVIKKLCGDMCFTMVKKDGVGLAAPQIGKNIRLIVVNTKDGVLALINPKIISKSLIKEWGEEGCLSVPGYFGQVKRNKKIKCAYINLEGKSIELEASGMLARVMEHEIDHLDGILFIDKARDLFKQVKN
jgi:peptide deformylase